MSEVRNWSCLAKGAPEHLFVGAPAERLPALLGTTDLVAFGTNGAAGLVSPMLRRAVIDLDGDRWDSRIGLVGPIRSLAIAGARGLATVPALSAPDELETLKISGAKVVDLRGLEGAVNLVEVDLSDVEGVASISSLIGLTELERVSIRGARIIDDLQDLGMLMAPTVVISHRGAIDDESARALVAHHPEWRIADLTKRRGDPR